MPTVQTGDIETYYERRGDGPPVVFVHGAIMDHRQWKPQLDALSDAYTVIAYDVRGHGRTGGSPRARYSVDLLADDLSAFLAALDVESPVLCGLSMGGCIAQVFAARYPDRVAGLVLADTFAPEILGVGEWLQRVVLLRATVPPIRLVGYERVEQALVWLQERFQGADVSGDYARIQALREAGPKMETAEFAKVVRTLARFDETALDHSAITAPTLVLYGEHDVGFVRRHAVRFGTVIPDATVRAVPDAGHTSNIDNPAFFSDALRAFLEERVRIPDAS